MKVITRTPIVSVIGRSRISPCNRRSAVKSFKSPIPRFEKIPKVQIRRSEKDADGRSRE
jgi:hypothetical protein